MSSQTNTKITQPHISENLDSNIVPTNFSQLENIINQSDSIAYLRLSNSLRSVKYISKNISILGYTPEEFYNQDLTLTDLIHPDDIAQVKAKLKFAHQHNAPKERLEYRMIAKNGNIFWMSDVFEIVRDKNNNITHYQGIITDIGLHKEVEDNYTAQRRLIQLRTEALLQLNLKLRAKTDELHEANDKLSESEQKFKVISEQSILAIIIIQDGAIKYFNDAFIQLTRFSRDDISKWKDYEFLNYIHPDDVVLVEETIQKIDEGELNTEFHFEFRRIDPNKQEKWLAQWSKAIMYESKKASLVILSDVDEKKKWQNALTESENRLRAKLDFILSPEKKIGDISISDIFDLEQIQKLQDAFATSHGVASVITDIEGNPITQPSNFSKICTMIRATEIGLKHCIQSDKTIGQKAQETLKPFSAKCHSCGFIDAGAPIIVGGKHIANWMIGQAVNANIEETKLLEFSDQIKIDRSVLLNELKKMKFISKEQFDKIVEFLWLLAKEISALGYNNLKLALDIEDRKMIENAMRESEELYRQLVHTSPDGITLSNLKGDMLYVSPKAKQLFGFPDDYPTDRLNIFNYIDPQNLEVAINGFRNAALVPNSKSNSYTMRRRDDSVFIAEINSAPIKDYNGQIRAVISILRDITERKQVEAELINAKNKAEESDRLKSAFLANMSHEIRTPMNGILGFANLLGESDTTEEERNEYIEIINQNGNILLKLIDDILDIARLEADQLKIFEGSCNINQILNDLYIQYDKLIQKEITKNIRLVLNKTNFGKLGVIVADSARLNQVFTNLISNAIKFTDNGKIEFGYNITHEDFIQFYVSDTGIGLAPGKKEIIFDRFRQADESKIRKYGGAGLGLAISSNLIKLMGGEIWVESELGVGSTFYFTIPLKRMEAKQVNNAETKSKKNISFNWENRHILITEDEYDNFMFLRELLKGTKVKITHAQNGNEALNLCKSEQSFDLILMDIKMPELNGCLATREIKKLHNSIPIIAQTAYAMENEIIDCIQSGCDDYIVKPIDHHLLLQKINHYFSK